METESEGERERESGEEDRRNKENNSTFLYLLGGERRDERNENVRNSIAYRMVPMRAEQGGVWSWYEHKVLAPKPRRLPE